MGPIAYIIAAFKKIYQESIIWNLLSTAVLAFVGMPVITAVYDLVLFCMVHPFV